MYPRSEYNERMRGSSTHFPTVGKRKNDQAHDDAEAHGITGTTTLLP